MGGRLKAGTKLCCRADLLCLHNPHLVRESSALMFSSEQVSHCACSEAERTLSSLSSSLLWLFKELHRQWRAFVQGKQKIRENKSLSRAGTTQENTVFGFDAFKLLNFLCLCVLLGVKFLFVYMTLIAGSSSAPMSVLQGNLREGIHVLPIIRKAWKDYAATVPVHFSKCLLSIGLPIII